MVTLRPTVLRPTVLRPTVLRPAWLLCSVALLAACGTASVTGSGAGGGTTGTDLPTTPPTSASSTMSSTGAAAFPLTVNRLGGVAGFNDSIVVRSDGQASVKAKQGAPTTCRIGADDLKRLTGQITSLLTTPHPTPPVMTPDHVRADAIIITVADDAGLSFRMPDPPEGDAQQAILALVNDVVGAAPPHQICRTS